MSTYFVSGTVFTLSELGVIGGIWPNDLHDLTWFSSISPAACWEQMEEGQEPKQEGQLGS